MNSLRSVWQIINQHYPFDLAESWDSSSLILGDWNQPISKILLSTDLTQAVVERAVQTDCQLVISHHPLWLGRHSAQNAPYKLDTARYAISHGLALLNAHTNADNANPGVSDAIALKLKLSDVRPLIPNAESSKYGTGRVGEISTPMSLKEFAEFVDATLQTARMRYAGDPAIQVKTVAVVGGAGDAFLANASAAADVYVTSDIRHHPLQEHLEAGGCPIVEINHSVAESLWLTKLAEQLSDFEVVISDLDTRGWN